MYQEVNLNNTFKLKNDVIINTIKDYPSDYKINKDILISKNFKHFLERTLIEQDDFEKNFRLKYRRDISVNFDRIPEPNSLSIEIDNPRLHSVIQELAANCCRILGLNSSNRIVVKSTKLRSGLNGTFNLAYDMSGTVTISEDIIKSASITKEGFMQLVSTLAHEMYHARQAMLFPSFFANRMSKYITSESGTFEEYQAQVIEIGARAFADAFIKYFMREPTKRFKDLNSSETFLANSKSLYSKLPGIQSWLDSLLREKEEQLIRKFMTDVEKNFRGSETLESTTLQ